MASLGWKGLWNIINSLLLSFHSSAVLDKKVCDKFVK
jgi:hypothetical protein